MKKLAFAALAAALMAGCSSTSSVSAWQQDNSAVISESSVELKSNLWVNLMPTLGEIQEQNLHGALYLAADQELPASLKVDHLIIKQGEEEWEIDGGVLELRTHSENQWEVAFVWQLGLDVEQPVDVAVQLEDGMEDVWLVEKGVKIEKVY